MQQEMRDDLVPLQTMNRPNSRRNHSTMILKSCCGVQINERLLRGIEMSLMHVRISIHRAWEGQPGTRGGYLSFFAAPDSGDMQDSQESEYCT